MKYSTHIAIQAMETDVLVVGTPHEILLYEKDYAFLVETSSSRGQAGLSIMRWEIDIRVS